VIWPAQIALALQMKIVLNVMKLIILNLIRFALKIVCLINFLIKPLYCVKIVIWPAQIALALQMKIVLNVMKLIILNLIRFALKIVCLINFLIKFL
jgi:hypothetical protein